jgi:hypothetical protein
MIDNTRPTYRVLALAGFFGPDDTLYSEGAEIYFDGEPNEELEPLNALAEEKMQAYLQKLDDSARDVALKLNRPYNGRPKTIDGAFSTARAIELAGIPVMGNLQPKESTEIASVTATVHETGRRGRGRPTKALAV